MRKLDTITFIDRSNVIHKNKYDYSKVEYNGMKTKVTIICPIHGEFEQLPKYHTSKKRGCSKCSMPKKQPIAPTESPKEKFIKEVSFKYNNLYIYDNYIDQHTKIDIYCSKHKKHFKQTPMFHKRNTGCPECVIDKKVEQIFKLIYKIHSQKYDYNKEDIYESIILKNRHHIVRIYCKQHGEFEQKLKIHLDGCGCPKCKISKGERKIMNFFEKNHLLFEHEKKFSNCKNKNILPFDFYLPDLNICVEYDGIQHFEEIEYFGGENTLKYIQQNDQIKNNFCRDNDIRIIRIRYDKYNNIDNILKDTLCEN